MKEGEEEEPHLQSRRPRAAPQAPHLGPATRPHEARDGSGHCSGLRSGHGRGHRSGLRAPLRAPLRTPLRAPPPLRPGPTPSHVRTPRPAGPRRHSRSVSRGSSASPRPPRWRPARCRTASSRSPAGLRRSLPALPAPSAAAMPGGRQGDSQGRMPRCRLRPCRGRGGLSPLTAAQPSPAPLPARCPGAARPLRRRQRRREGPGRGGPAAPPPGGSGGLWRDGSHRPPVPERAGGCPRARVEPPLPAETPRLGFEESPEEGAARGRGSPRAFHRSRKGPECPPRAAKATAESRE